MFEKLNSPEELFHYKLGAALTMENTVLSMLDDLVEASQRPQLKEQFRHHAEETQEQIRNIQRAFGFLGEEPDDSPCPAIQGIEKEGKANIKQAGDEIVDAVILSGAAETEHHEIAVYEGLITAAEAMSKHDIVEALRHNLEQEQHALEEVKRATQQLAQEQFATA